MLKWIEKLFYDGVEFSSLFDVVLPTDDEVANLVRSIPTHEAVTFTSATSNTGTTTATAPATTGVTWTLTSLSISQSGGSIGPNAKVTIYDGAVGGTVIFQGWLSSPGAAMFSSPGAVTGGLGGSVGIIQPIPLPKTPAGIESLQGTPGNAMNIQVTGTSNNNTAINARFSDAMPPN